MRVAFARAGIWFFTSILVALLLTGGAFENGKKGFTVDALLPYVGIGVLFGGLIFFITWYNTANEERKLELRERRKTLKE